MINLFHVFKYYVPGVPALADLSFSIKKGEFCFITGPSGAGKTTLFKLLFGAESASDGQILVDGRNLSRIKGRHLALFRRRIGIVFQDFKLIDNQTIFQNIAVALEVRGEPYDLIKKKINRALSMVGLEKKADKQTRTLSGGEQQRVAVVRAMINDPVIILADEPTGNLDSQHTEKIFNLFKEINLRGATVMLATHNTALFNMVKNKRIIELRDGIKQ